MTPVIVNVNVPAGVLELVVTFKELTPEPPAIELGLNEAVLPAGSPLTLRATSPVKPPVGVTVAV